MFIWPPCTITWQVPWSSGCVSNILTQCALLYKSASISPVEPLRYLWYIGKQQQQPQPFRPFRSDQPAGHRRRSIRRNQHDYLLVRRWRHRFWYVLHAYLYVDLYLWFAAWKNGSESSSGSDLKSSKCHLWTFFAHKITKLKKIWHIMLCMSLLLFFFQKYDILVSFPWFLQIFLLPGSGSGRSKWYGSDRIRIHITDVD